MSVVAEIRVTMDDAGQVRVEGPTVGNPVVALGLLEFAKQAVLQQAGKPAQRSSIIPARAVPPPGFNPSGILKPRE